MSPLFFFVLACFVPVSPGAHHHTRIEDVDDLIDFDFNNEPAETRSADDKHTNKLDAIFDEDGGGGANDSFADKEKRIQNALMRSTSDKKNRHMMTQILPILRSLSKPQKMALVAIVSAQADLKNGMDDLSFDEVSHVMLIKFNADTNDQKKKINFVVPKRGCVPSGLESNHPNYI